MIQIRYTCTDVDAFPMHPPSVRALDKHQHQRTCTGFDFFVRNKAYAFIDPEVKETKHTYALIGSKRSVCS